MLLKVLDKEKGRTRVFRVTDAYGNESGMLIMRLCENMKGSIYYFERSVGCKSIADMIVRTLSLSNETSVEYFCPCDEFLRIISAVA